MRKLFKCEESNLNVKIMFTMGELLLFSAGKVTR